LNLRAALKTAVTRSGMDAPVRAVSGLTPSAKALFVAAAAHAQPHGVVLYVVPGDGDLEETCANVSFFLAALEGLAPAAIERVVLPYPSHEVDPYRGLAPHIGVTSVRARALYAIAQGTARIVIASAAAVLPRVTTPDRMQAASLALKPGQDISPIDLAELLVDAGFSREDPADEHGEFAIRGGIADVFPAGETHPVRLEFIGDTIETLRTYDPSTQRSIAPIDQVAIVPLRDVLQDNRGATIFDYLARASASRIIVSERDEVDANAAKVLEQIQRSYADIRAAEHAPQTRASSVPAPDDILVDWDTVAARFSQATTLAILGLDDSSREIRSQPAMELKGRVADWVAEIRRLRDEGESVLFVAATPGRAERTIELLKEYEVFAIPVERAEDARYAAVLVAVGALSRGFRLPDAGLQIYAEADVFEEERRAPERRRAATKAFLSDLRDLKVGDFVVHVDNGIGMFVGLKQIGIGDSMQEFLELRYAGEDKLFVPVERLDLVQKFTGATKPPIDRLGGTSWERAKSKVKKAMRDMAEELLKLYAARKAVPGHAFAPDSHWQQEFEDAFEYDLTIDQTSAITDIKKDMETPTPMDRLLCGDVGYGKTEVAMRAAFKAVMDG
jgi:transcription-repair coupling factor (superfamily II helicase)